MTNMETIKGAKYIPITEVPYKRITKWDAMFDSIPKRQALVLSEPEVNGDNVIAALRRRQKENKYRNIEIITRGVRGKRTIYVINKQQ